MIIIISNNCNGLVFSNLLPSIYVELQVPASAMLAENDGCGSTTLLEATRMSKKVLYPQQLPESIGDSCQCNSGCINRVVELLLIHDLSLIFQVVY